MSKKKMLIYAHYYSPDVASTGQLLKDLAEGMLSDFDVTVICAVPSYTGVIPDNYREKKFYTEELDGVKVLRVPVPPFLKSSKKSRIRNLFAYFMNARRACKYVGRQDFVFAISQPPVLGGILGLYAARKLKNADGKHPKFIYCIQDFNPEQIMATGYFKFKAVLKLLLFLDKRTCRKSDLVITVGRDLIETLKNRFAGSKIPNHVMINNWIDERSIIPLANDNPQVRAFRKEWGLEGKFVFMYSGNIGLYYDLEGIVNAISELGCLKCPDGREVVFAFVGEGSVLHKLRKICADKRVDTVCFIPYQEREKLVYSLNAADVHWCVNANGIKGVSCPSKFYGIISAGKPVIGVLEKGSEIRMLMEEIGCGLVSDPKDYKAVKENIDRFINHSGDPGLADMGRKGREYLEKHLTKNLSIAKYIESIKALEE